MAKNKKRARAGVGSRIRLWLAKAVFNASQITFVPDWLRTSFMDPTWRALIADGLKGNSAVSACVTALAFAFPEPKLEVLVAGDQGLEVVPDHPVRKLMAKPNPDMGEMEFYQTVIVYASMGGNFYAWKQRDQVGRVIALWPMHAGQITPVPGRNTSEGLVRHFDYTYTSGVTAIPIPKEDMIHWKWMVDPEQPWVGMGAVVASAKEVDTDTEATRYLFALLKNDAMPRVAITLPTSVDLTDAREKRLKAQWADRHGGDKRGGAAFLEHGMTLERISFNLAELAYEALKAVPEARIAANFRVPAIIAGLSTGLSRSTYSNYEEARKSWAEDTLVPLWVSFASELQQSLAVEYGDIVLRFDTSQVQALQADIGELWTRIQGAWDSGLITRWDGRQILGLEVLDVDQVFKVQLSQFFVPREDEPPPPIEPFDFDDRDPTSFAGLSKASVDGHVAAGDAPVWVVNHLAKQRGGRRAAGRQLAQALQIIRRSVAGRLEAKIDSFFLQLGEKVEARLGPTTPPTQEAEVEEQGADLTVSTKKLPAADKLLFPEDFDEMGEIMKQHTLELMMASWDIWNIGLGVTVNFDLFDPVVSAAINGAGQNITGLDSDVYQSTLEKIEELLQHGNEEGWGPDQIARGDDETPGLRDVVTETYKNRGKTIARTELGEAQNLSTVGRYASVGVKEVLVLDNGQADADDECAQANGQIWSLKKARANPLAHPNCTRAFAPHFE